MNSKWLCWPFHRFYYIEWKIDWPVPANDTRITSTNFHFISVSFIVHSFNPLPSAQRAYCTVSCGVSIAYSLHMTHELTRLKQGKAKRWNGNRIQHRWLYATSCTHKLPSIKRRVRQSAAEFNRRSGARLPCHTKTENWTVSRHLLHAFQCETEGEEHISLYTHTYSMDVFAGTHILRLDPNAKHGTTLASRLQPAGLHISIELRTLDGCFSSCSSLAQTLQQSPYKTQLARSCNKWGVLFSFLI